MHRLLLDSKMFWRLPIPRRLIGAALAMLLAFWTFIAGLVVLFDRVGATEGYSTRAWVVSLIGLILAAVIGLCLGGAMLPLFNRLSQRAGKSSWRFIVAAVAATAGTFIVIVLLTALTST